MDRPQANSADQPAASAGAAKPEADRVEVDPATSAPPPLRANSTLGDAMTAFDEYMLGKGFSDNTIKAFRNDLKILRAFMDDSALLRQIQTKDLNDFLDW
ncbi:MAG: site-specific integrase, partial [Caldilineaceae bacterium]|nr:site-specific integrase [Caldilineaceae bacterium]